MGNGNAKVATTTTTTTENRNHSSVASASSHRQKLAVFALAKSISIPRSSNIGAAPIVNNNSSSSKSMLNCAMKPAVLLENMSRASTPSALPHPRTTSRSSRVLQLPTATATTLVRRRSTMVGSLAAAAAATATTMASVSCAMAVPVTQLVVAVADVSSAIAAVTALSSAINTSTTYQTPTSDDDLIAMDLANASLSLFPAIIHYYSNFDVSYIAKINPFWLQFKPPNTRTYYTMAILYSIISGVGCIGNALVIFMFLRCKSLRTPANTLVINLAVSDLIMLAKCPIAIYNNFKEGPALGDMGCRIYGFIGGLSGTASIGTLTAIALDRYNVVVHPLDPLRKSSKLRPQLIITVIWIYSFIFSVAPALNIGLSEYVPEGFLTTCSFDYLNKETKARVFMFLFFVAAWCVPFGTICYCYFYILKVVYAANRIQSSKDKNKTEQKLAMIVVGIIGLWFLAWTPYSIVAMMGVFGKEQYITPLGSMIPALFCKTAACIDPYIYAATHPRFRMEFQRLLHGKTQMRRSSTMRSSYMTRSTTTRRLHVIGDVDTRNRSSENAKNHNLQSVPELTEENDEYDIIVEELRELSSTMEQSRF